MLEKKCGPEKKIEIPYLIQGPKSPLNICWLISNEDRSTIFYNTSIPYLYARQTSAKCKPDTSMVPRMCYLVADNTRPTYLSSSMNCPLLQPLLSFEYRYKKFCHYLKKKHFWNEKVNNHHISLKYDSNTNRQGFYWKMV